MNKIRLFCFPFAGGSQYSFNGFVKHAPENLVLHPLDLPGRGRRLGEACLTNMEDLVRDALPSIEPYAHQPYAIYGHSMGSLLGLLVARRIFREQLPPPLALILSGRGAPSVRHGRPPKYLLPRPQFIARLKEMGGDTQVFEDEKLMEFFEPILRADMQAGETYIYENHPPMDIPITLLIGSEEGISDEEVQGWQKESRFPLDVITMPGNHFFILDHEQAIMELIARKLIASSRSSHAQ
ncbi:MAG: alpha/beta fold hydrolase [Bacteroidota bacterium]